MNCVIKQWFNFILQVANLCIENAVLKLLYRKIACKQASPFDGAYNN